jgi:hypothetical protein
MLEAHERYIREHFDDLPEIKNWVWSPDEKGSSSFSVEKEPKRLS